MFNWRVSPLITLPFRFKLHPIYTSILAHITPHSCYFFLDLGPFKKYLTCLCFPGHLSPRLGKQQHQWMLAEISLFFIQNIFLYLNVFTPTSPRLFQLFTSESLQSPAKVEKYFAKRATLPRAMQVNQSRRKLLTSQILVKFYGLCGLKTGNKEDQDTPYSVPVILQSSAQISHLL